MKIALLLSGGVDSSVALKLMQAEGFEVHAFYLKIWLEDELNFLGECPWEEDLKVVQEVCQKTGTSLEVISLQKEYYDRIVEYTISEIKKGNTPNPDVLCNERIKFGVFYENFHKQFDRIATGHYADIEKIKDFYYLKRSPDLIKDQTYFLSSLKQEQLAKVIFPIGRYKKEEVRKMAKEFDLPNMGRKDSQGLCFLGKIKFREFIKANLGVKKGKIVDIDTGKVLGEHDGFYYYTIGQRHGLDLSGGPWFVCQKDIDSNIIYVSNQITLEEKMTDTFSLDNLNWIPKKPLETDLLCKVRHGERFYQAKIKENDGGKLIVNLDQKDKGIAPGQFAVFYNENYCLGSGMVIP